jgi:Family of unknown function (DUF5681)
VITGPVASVGRAFEPQASASLGFRVCSPRRGRARGLPVGRCVIADEARQISRTALGRFPPGVSGNPRGRPKTLSGIQHLAREYSQPALEKLVRLMQHGKPHAVQLSAAVAIIDRAWGKPVQAVEHSGPEGERLFPAPADLDDEDLDRMLQLARELRAAAAGNGHSAP